MSSSSFPYGVLRPVAAGGSVLLNAFYVSTQFDAGVLCTAGFAFQPDGSIDDVGPNNTDRTQTGPGTWWTDEPEVAIGASYDIRCASLSSGTWSIQAASVGTYIDMSVERLWRVTVIAMASPAIKSCVGVFAIRPTGGGADLDSGTFDATAEN